MQKRLTKSSKNKMLTGVLGGLGKHFGIDPTYLRLIFVALTLFTGFFLFLLLYLLADWVMPREDDDSGDKKEKDEPTIVITKKQE